MEHMHGEFVDIKGPHGAIQPACNVPEHGYAQHDGMGAGKEPKAMPRGVMLRGQP